MVIQNMLTDFKQERDLVGLWQVVGRFKDAFPEIGNGELQDSCLGFVGLMLSEGFQAGNPPYSIGGFSKWPDQSPEVVLTRIRDEWNALAREPNIPDIVWFLPPQMNN